MKQASTSKTIEQGKEEVGRLCQYFTTNRQAFLAPGVNEAQVRQSLIDPVFEALAWDVRNKALTAPQYREVIPEDSLDVEGQQNPQSKLLHKNRALTLAANTSIFWQTM